MSGNNDSKNGGSSSTPPEGLTPQRQCSAPARLRTVSMRRARSPHVSSGPSDRSASGSGTSHAGSRCSTSKLVPLMPKTPGSLDLTKTTTTVEQQPRRRRDAHRARSRIPTPEITEVFTNANFPEIDDESRAERETVERDNAADSTEDIIQPMSSLHIRPFRKF